MIEHLEFLLETTKRCGEFQLQHFNKVKYDMVSDKGLNQLVSYVDVESEQMLVQACQSLGPADFVTEENTVQDQRSDKGEGDTNEGQGEDRRWRWIIDPLDGTTNFLHGLPVFSISLALQDRGETVLGIVDCPALHETFWAVKGEGAWLNGHPISVSETDSLKSSLIATGFPYFNFDKMKPYTDVLQALMSRTHGLRRMGSAAIDLAYTACGRFEGFYEMNLSPWDVAAGALLITEAGGRVADFKGGSGYIFGKEILGSNSALHEEFAGLVMEHLGT